MTSAEYSIFSSRRTLEGVWGNAVSSSPRVNVKGVAGLGDEPVKTYLGKFVVLYCSVFLIWLLVSRFADFGLGALDLGSGWEGTKTLKPRTGIFCIFTVCTR